MTARTSDLDRLVPAPEAARLLGISRRTLGRLIARGSIRACKLAPHQRGRVLVPESELRRYAAQMVRA